MTGDFALSWVPYKCLVTVEVRALHSYIHATVFSDSNLTFPFLLSVDLVQGIPVCNLFFI